MNIEEYRDQQYLNKRMISRRFSSLEQAIKKRKCHHCGCGIRKGEKHVANYESKGQFQMWPSRTNICFMCVEKLLYIIKKSIKGGVKLRRREHDVEIVLKAL